MSRNRSLQLNHRSDWFREDVSRDDRASDIISYGTRQRRSPRKSGSVICLVVVAKAGYRSRVSSSFRRLNSPCDSCLHMRICICLRFE